MQSMVIMYMKSDKEYYVQLHKLVSDMARRERGSPYLKILFSLICQKGTLQSPPHTRARAHIYMRLRLSINA